MSAIRLSTLLVAFTLITTAVPTRALAQDAPPAPGAPPVVVPLSGQLVLPTGEPRSGSAALTIALYAEREDVTPLWSETQTVVLDASGRYGVQFGATRPDGFPRSSLPAARRAG